MAKKKSKNNSSGLSIVTINKPTERTFCLSDNEISIYDISKSIKNKLFISYIQYKDIMTSTVELPRDVNEDEVPDTIAIKVYEELNLDSSIDYKITYSETTSAGDDSRYFNVFVVNQNLISQLFEPVAQQTNYIDYIALAPFLMSGLYDRNILPAEGADCFIYLQRDDAFMAIYRDGQYFQSRSLRYTLKYICDKYCEFTGNRIDENSFYSKLKTEGINFENQIERDYLLQILDDTFFYAGDIITSINKLYGINIQNVYFSTDIGDIPGVEVFIEDRLGLVRKQFNFNIALNSKSYDITQLDTLMMLVAQNYINVKDDEYNYSTYQRPAPLFQRKSGNLIKYAIAGIILAGAYPAYQFAYGMYLSFDTKHKSDQYQVAHTQEIQIQARLASIDRAIKNVNEATSKLKAETSSKELLLENINQKKNEYNMKAVAIYTLSRQLNANNVNVVEISGNDKNITLSTTARKDTYTTNLIKDIQRLPQYDVNTKLITRYDDNKTPSYDSNITVEFKK